MRRRWKIVLALLLLLVLSQAPFAYRRYRFARLHAAIERLNAGRAAPAADDPFVDLEGVVHVHTSLGGHSTGTPAEVVAAAKAAGLDFVLMTEHPSRYVDTARATLDGPHDGVLFVGGSELNVADEDRLLVVPGVSPPPGPGATTQAVVNQAKAAGNLVFVAYPERLRSWDLQGFDGLEVYNLYTDARRASYALLFFDGLWSYGGYPELLFTDFCSRPDDNLRRWDELTAAGRRLVAVAGNDAHQNVGLSFQEQTGSPLLRLQLDPYERSFRIVRTHLLLERGRALDRAALLDALARGHSFVAFDLFGDAGGFRFDADNGAERRVMGDEIALASGVRLAASVPVRGRIVFFRDGRAVHEERDAQRAELAVKEPGVYRVEVYLDRLGPPLDALPWIISNPIYVKN